MSSVDLIISIYRDTQGQSSNIIQFLFGEQKETWDLWGMTGLHLGLIWRRWIMRNLSYMQLTPELMCGNREHH
jgi:hypothetical protein